MTWGTHCPKCGREDCAWLHGERCEGQSRIKPRPRLEGEWIEEDRNRNGEAAIRLTRILFLSGLLIGTLALAWCSLD